MKWMSDITIHPLPMPIQHLHKVLMVGSCFTEHISKSLRELIFNVLENPNGIIFETKSVCRSLVSYVQDRRYTPADLFQLNELYHSWDHHGRISHPDEAACLQQINESQERAHAFVLEADWLIITLGSSFVYRLYETRADVANCHKAPGQWFEKYLVPIEEQLPLLDNCIHQLFHANTKLK
ncbi:MAG TPA: GSCFA domain-containing protein, partial [Lacibacter sp.]|nr:GSCFA domain-containing protein [Lacibacter sp.]